MLIAALVVSGLVGLVLQISGIGGSALMARIYKAHVTKRGEQKWGVDYKDPHTDLRVQRVVGSHARAQAELARVLTEIEDGRYESRGGRSNTTLDELRGLWLADRAWKGSIRHDENRWGYIIDHFGPETRIDKITVSAAASFRAALLSERRTRFGKGLRPATVNRTIVLAKAAFGLAKKRKLIRDNPFNDIDLLPEHNERVRVASADEYKMLVLNAPASLRLAIRVAYCTGMRLGEIVALKRQHIDFEKRTITIPRTKTDRARTIPLRSAGLLRTLKRKAGPIFAVTGGGLSSMFRDLTRRLGIEGLHFHDLRATFATRWLSRGASTLVVKRILGHQTYVMVERYARLVADDLHAALSTASSASARVKRSRNHRRKRPRKT